MQHETGNSFHRKAERNLLREFQRHRAEQKQTVTPEEGDAYTEYTADEVYFETSHSLDEVQADKDTYWSYGETWQPGVQDEGIMDNKELTEGFNSLQSGQLDLYDAIASLYETVSL